MTPCSTLFGQCAANFIMFRGHVTKNQNNGTTRLTIRLYPL